MGYRVLFLLLFFIHNISLAKDTEINLFRPYAENEKHASPVIEKVLKAQCSQQSLRIKREDAWRCQSEEGYSFDPCFSKKYGSLSRVICPHSPWDVKSAQLMLSIPLSLKNQQVLDISKALPWAIQLNTGERCLSVDVEDTVEGLPVQYQCDKGGVLLGVIHRCAPTWTVLRSANHEVTSTDILAAWF